MISRRRFTANAMALGLSGAVPRGAFARGALHRTLRILAPQGSEANIKPAMERFQQLTGCASELVVVRGNEINAVLSLESLLMEFNVDVALPATYGIPDLVQAGAILPLDSLAQAFGPDDLSDQLLYKSGDHFDGNLWGYQTDGDVYLMFCNKSFLNDPEAIAAYGDLYGKALAPPQTWQELDQQMAFFHRPDEGRYGGCLFRSPNNVVWEWWARLHALGIWPLSPDMEPQISGSGGLAALEAMIASTAHLHGQDLALFANWKRFAKADIFASLGWGGTQKYMRTTPAMRDNVVNAPLPGGSIGGVHVPLSYFNWGWSYVVARNSKSPELAYQFCAQAVSRDVGAKAIAQADGFFDPFREDQYEEPAILDAYGREFLNVHQEAMRHPIPDLYIARRSEYFDALSYWIIAALAGEVSPKRALQNAAQSWRSTTKRAGLAAQSRRWRALRAAYPPALKAVLRDE